MATKYHIKLTFVSVIELSNMSKQLKMRAKKHMESSVQIPITGFQNVERNLFTEKWQEQKITSYPRNNG